MRLDLEAPACAPAPAPEAAREAAPRPVILLVDDERSVLSALRRVMMRRARVDVVTEDAPERALERVAALAPAVIVSDYRMPRMSGTAFLAAARERAPDATHVLLSGEADRDAVIQALNQGAVYRYLDKPWDEDELVAVIEEGVARSVAAARERERAMRLEHERQALRSTLEQQEAALERARFRDPVTHLANRDMLEQCLQRRLSGMHQAGCSIAVLALGVGQLDLVRESLGRAAADRVLAEIAGRLAGHVRGDDMLARTGDATLMLMLGNLRSAGEARAVAERMIADIARPVATGAGDAYVTGTAGVSLFPDDAVDAAMLATHAEAALRRAQGPGGRVCSYRAEFNLEAQAQLTLEAALREAVAARDFTLHYQPRVDAASGRVTGAEALLRWQHPQHGNVSPARFVPLLESTGLIVELGTWVIEEAARALARWRARGLAHLDVSVNVSALQFQHGDMVAVVRDALAAAGEPFDGGRLELELTESLLMGEGDAGPPALAALREAGVPLAIDDFGTGYSSLGYLVNMPLDVLKVDRSFIHRLTDEPHVAKVMHALVAMAHALDMRVVAEGVETDAQRAMLVSLGCDELQGWLTGRPVPETELLASLG